jgi:hypothetical protein
VFSQNHCRKFFDGSLSQTTLFSLHISIPIFNHTAILGSTVMHRNKNYKTEIKCKVNDDDQWRYSPDRAWPPLRVS